jgi:hypothetical protein
VLSRSPDVPVSRDVVGVCGRWSIVE